MKKSEINPDDVEKDINKLLSFLENIDNLDIENTDFSKLEKDVKLFKKDIPIIYTMEKCNYCIKVKEDLEKENIIR